MPSQMASSAGHEPAREITMGSSQVLNATRPVLPLPLPRFCCRFTSGFLRRRGSFDTGRQAVYPLAPRTTAFRSFPQFIVARQDTGGDEGQESGDSGSQGNEGSAGSSVSRQSALPAQDPQQRAPHVEEAPSDSGARRQRRSATSPTSHHHERPRLEGSPGTGTSPPLSSASRSMDCLLYTSPSPRD